MSLPKFDGTKFGSVTINGRLYPHDIYVYADGKIERRTSSHVVNSAEMERALRGEPEVIVIGTGQAGCVVVERAAQEIAKKRGVRVVQSPTPRAIEEFNKLAEEGRRVCSIVHVTC